MVIKGYGIGAAVTAAGVFAESSPSPTSVNLNNLPIFAPNTFHNAPNIFHNKRKRINLMRSRVLSLSTCVFMISFLSTSLFSQEKIIETQYFKHYPDLGGDVVIRKATKEVIGEKSYITFEIQAKESGSYSLALWVSPVMYPDGTYSSYDVFVNGRKTSEQVKFRKGNWQAITLSEKIKVKEGDNVIVFSAGKEEIPAIEFIRLSTDADKVKISSAKYDDYLASAKANSLKPVNQEKQITDSLSFSLSNVEPSLLQADPEKNYLFFGHASFSYTYYRTHYFTANQTVSVSAYTPNSDLLVIEIFSFSTPETYTWSTSIQTNPSISVPIPVEGIYYVRVRPYRNNTLTTATVTTNGTVETDVPVFSVGVRAIQNTTTVYNTFTVLSAGDPRIWITEYASTEKITHYNDDYGYHGGNFSWGLNSRIKKQFPRQVDAILLSSYGTNNPTGTCELYAKCQNSNITSSFPSLTIDDAIQSAPSSSVYNCISWSGGITNYWEWPLSTTSDYYVPNNPIGSFDLFYVSERYPGCGIYIRAGATSANSVVDLWATGSAGNYDYTHASIKRGADENTHGYDWESKPGNLMRTFHPRTALTGTAYGNIVAYYRNVRTETANYTLTEAIAEGKAVLEDVRFDDKEIAIIRDGITSLSPNDILIFQTLFAAWASTLESTPFSNPYSFKNTQYISLLKFCRSKQDLIFLVYDKLGNGEQFAMLLVEDLTLTDNAKNLSILKSIKDFNKQTKVTSSGATIVRSPYSNTIKYVKALLSERTYGLRAATASSQLGDWISYDGEEMVSQILKDGTTLWIAGNAGLLHLDTETEELTVHKIDIDSDLPRFRNLAKDNDGSLWITTQRNGIVNYDGQKIVAHYKASNSALSDNQYCISIAIDTSNNKWIGSLLHLNRFDGTAWQAWTTPQSVVANYWFIYDLKFDHNGDLWMGGSSPEWSFAKFTGQEIQPIPEITKTVHRILIDRDNNKWLASSDGLIKYDGRQFVTWNAENSSLPATDIYDIKQDASGILWLACNKYLVRFDGREFTDYTIPLLQESNQGDFILCLELDDRGNIWVGTKLNGLFKFTPSQESFQRILKSPPTSIIPLSVSAFDISPNPVDCSSVLNIRSEKMLDTIEVYDLSGHQIQCKHIGNTSIQIPISALNIFRSGIYMLKLIGATGITTKKLIVK